MIIMYNSLKLSVNSLNFLLIYFIEYKSTPHQVIKSPETKKTVSHNRKRFQDLNV